VPHGSTLKAPIIDKKDVFPRNKSVGIMGSKEGKTTRLQNQQVEAKARWRAWTL
jgi:hypothetical protein